MKRFTRAIAALVVAALAAALGAASATGDVNTPPTLIDPAPGAIVQAGTPLAFRVTTDYAGDTAGYLWLVVSTSPNLAKACGTIDSDAELERLTPTSTAGVYEARPTFFDYPAFWMNTPGVYYWQAYRISYAGGADGCIESEIRTFQIVPKTAPAPTPKPTPPTPKPTPTPAAKPLASARLADAFDVTIRLTAVSGLGNVKRGHVETAAWTFRPVCSNGACAVRLQLPRTMFGSKSATLRLGKTGASYKGTGTAYFAQCMLKPVPGATTVRLTTTAGRWIDGTWRATRVTGSLRYAAPTFTTGSFRCKATTLAATVRGQLSSDR